MTAPTLIAVMARYPPGAETTGPLSTPTGPVVVIAFDSTATNMASTTVDIWRGTGGGWQRVASVGGRGIDQLIGPSEPITVAQLTGAPAPDVLVHVLGGSLEGGGNGVVVSDHGGRWHIVTFVGADGGAGPSQEVGSPTVTGDVVVQTLDSCQPTCAGGSPVRTDFRYDPAADQFRRVH